MDVKSILAGTISLMLLASPGIALAQTPYWSNPSGSSSGSSFYTPPAQTQAPSNSYPNNGYGAQPNYNNYNQPNTYNPYAQQNTYSQAPYRASISTVPAGTNLFATNNSYISSATSRVGEMVTATLTNDISIGGTMALPAGTSIQGQVVSAIPAGRIGKMGQLEIRFNQANLPDGRQIPLSAKLMTQDGTGILRGGTSAERWGSAAKNTLGGAALGAASGAALGALVSGGKKWNEGLMWGSIIGAGGGLARTGIQRGDEAELPPGTPLQIMLDQPATVSPGSNSNYNNYNNSYPY